MIDCSIVIPIYNPEKGIEDVMFLQYNKLISSLPKKRFELIIVDDGSQESIGHILTKLRDRFQIVDYYCLALNKGKGAALRLGIEKARGEVILYTDYDFPYKIESMVNMIQVLDSSNKPMAIGVRPETYYDQIPRSRKTVSKILQMMNRSLMKLHTGDTQAGLKGFKKQLKAQFLSTRINGFLFDLEFLKKIKKEKIEAELVEIELRENVHLSELKLSGLFKELLNYLSLLFR